MTVKPTFGPLTFACTLTLSWHFQVISDLLTRDGDFGRPLGRPLQHGLFGCLQVGDKVFLRELKHLLNHLEHLGSVLLPDFHPFLHGHDDVLGFVLSSVFRAFLYCTYRG